MAGVKISDLSTVVPLLTDLLPIDRPTIGAGAPVTGKATLADVQALIGGGASSGNEHWESTVSGEIFATGTLAAVTGSLWAQFLSSSNGLQITGSFTHGINTSAPGTNTHAQGDSTTASGNYSHAEGAGTTASGDGSHAEGIFTIASGQGSHAQGDSTTASGDFSHAEGFQTTATGSFSHAEGDTTTASGPYAHAEGSGTAALAYASHAEGFGTEASGTFSHAEGQQTIASGSYQHVQGKYNLRNNDFSLFVIGDGDGDSNANRSDIVRVNSGSTPGTGRFEITGTVAVTRGLSGSLTRLTDGTSYLIAGSGVSISTGSSGAVTISATGGGSGSSEQYWFSSQNEAIYTSGSALFRGPAGINDSPSDFGSDIFFYVSGTKASKETATTGTAVFGGDAVISGSYYFGADGGNVVPLDFGVPLTQVGLLSTNMVEIKRSSYSVIEASYGIGFEANSYCAARSSYHTAGYGIYQSNYCTLDSTQNSSNVAHQFSNYSSIMASYGAQTAGSSYCFIAATSDTSGPAINGSFYSTTIATSDTFIQGFNRSAIIGGSNNILNGGFGLLDSSMILGGKNWTIQESDTIAMGAASGASTRLLVSASAGMYLGGNLQVTGSLDVTVGMTGSLYYSASNAAHWNGSAPTNVADALDRIAAFINSNIGPIT